MCFWVIIQIKYILYNIKISNYANNKLFNCDYSVNFGRSLENVEPKINCLAFLPGKSNPFNHTIICYIYNSSSYSFMLPSCTTEPLSMSSFLPTYRIAVYQNII